MSLIRNPYNENLVRYWAFNEQDGGWRTSCSPDLFFLISKKVSIGIVLLLQIIQMKYVY